MPGVLSDKHNAKFNHQHSINFVMQLCSWPAGDLSITTPQYYTVSHLVILFSAICFKLSSAKQPSLLCTTSSLPINMCTPNNSTDDGLSVAQL